MVALLLVVRVRPSYGSLRGMRERYKAITSGRLGGGRPAVIYTLLAAEPFRPSPLVGPSALVGGADLSSSCERVGYWSTPSDHSIMSV